MKKKSEKKKGIHDQLPSMKLNMKVKWLKPKMEGAEEGRTNDPSKKTVESRAPLYQGWGGIAIDCYVLLGESRKIKGSPSPIKIKEKRCFNFFLCKKKMVLKQPL